MTKQDLLTTTEADSLLEVLDERLDNGEHYGNAEQYRKRLLRIRNKINLLTK